MPTIVAVVPDIVQIDGVLELKVTGRPEVAVADNANEDCNAPAYGLDIAGKLIDCGPAMIEKVCVTCTAAYVVLPDWLAAIVQVPVEASERYPVFAYSIVHTDGVSELNVTVNPELAVAATKGFVP